ncbi:hypothetical protein W97_05634 [Coniosporium apollinis CBS 100218]|uniref:Sugar phosphate transporter domain-containing protein n=1 Tax=Coniosporium apollinis (strain CBS 100218) TaxID=1168221 RepID=R7YX55_CONA1|nr:uncharacterized protein W97_05634 [Coniosporium apollinis CBS 100218]EON66241.1 hypothetical protein W97_05634 [Coniosporium apollinis CBS 100218]
MVSVPFHQIMRSTCPVITIIIHRIWYSRTYSRATYLSILPIILGVGLATYGDYYFTTAGFLLTSAGVLLAAIKTVVSNRLMTGNLALPALEILLRMSPLAAVQSILYAGVIGELSAFLTYVRKGQLTSSVCIALVGNGVIAFLLNVASFQTNKLAGALTIAVCANVKQCLTIVLGIALFDVKVSLLNGAGIVVALLGGAWYSRVELESKGKVKSAARMPCQLPMTVQEMGK